MSRIVDESLKIGKSVLESPRTRKATLGAAMLGYGAYGMAKGLGNANLSDSFYDLTLGDPKADQSLLGTEVNPLSLMAPLPFTPMSILQGRTLGPRSSPAVSAGISGSVGALLGAGIPSMIARAAGKKLPIGGKIAGALLGAGAGVVSGVMGGTKTGRLLGAAHSEGFLNQRTASYIRYNNRPPEVDGSIAMGLYNARHGG